MTRSISKGLFLVFLLILLSIQGSYSLEQQNQVQSNLRQLNNIESPQNLNLDPEFGKIPLYFIPNKGQVNNQALFYAKASRYTLWLTKEGLAFDSTRRVKKESTESIRQNPRGINNPEDVTYDRDVSRLIFIDANRNPEVIPVDDTEHKVNYLTGNDKSKWQTNIQTSKAVLYRELYPNIDLKVYGIEKQIEYDFVVKPSGEVSDISFEYRDVKKTNIDKESNLVVETEFGEFAHTKPVCYQMIGGDRIDIGANFKRIENNSYGFTVEEYNKNYDLIIDPIVLVYSTYLGGHEDDHGSEIAVDSTGAVYVAGWTKSLDFPTNAPAQEAISGDYDVFITKINSTGSGLVYSTYIGGSGEENCWGMAVDLDGAAYVTGFTQSLDFPTKNPIQATYAGQGDVFITKLNSSGNALEFSTYLGGSDWDYGGSDITVDSKGSVYVTGLTRSTNFPTKNPFQGSNAGDQDAFITKLNSNGSGLIFSTYLGGSNTENGRNIEVDSEGAVYILGDTKSVNFPLQNPIQSSYGGGIFDTFITKINASGTAIIYSTYLGGLDYDSGNGLAVDSIGAAYVTGQTKSVNFPLHNPFQETSAGRRTAFVTKLHASGTALVYSTYLGGSSDEEGISIVLDVAGSAYVTGWTDSLDFPILNPFQSELAGGDDAFLTKLDTSGSSLVFSTYLGGSNNDSCYGAVVDKLGGIYLLGGTDSTNFPIQNPIQRTNAGGRDAFVTKISDSSERIRVVSWNILNYPDLNGEPREEYYQKVLEGLSPDILIVQEMTSSFGVGEFLNNVLKPISKKYRASKFFDGPDTDNVLFYDKTKVKLLSSRQIYSSFRDISEYSLKKKKNPGKGVKFKIYSVHFTEGLSAGDQTQREGEANTLRTHLDGLPPDDLFLVCGTFNMISSTEKAFNILTDDLIDDIGRLKDPLDMVGRWHHKKKYKSLHTESTRKAKLEDGASGGLNDRYDMILISYSLDQNGKLTYRPGSCVGYGNDGKHFKEAINEPKNGIVSLDIADALYKASDHLPVIIELIPQEKSK